MAKLLFMLGAFLLIGLTLLGLRVHRWEYERQSALLAQEVRSKSVPELWGQDDRIARETNPVVLPEHLKQVGLLPADGVPGQRGTRNPRSGSRHEASGDLLDGLGTRSGRR